MTTTTVEPRAAVLAAAQDLLTRRSGALVTLADPEELGGTSRAIVLRVRVDENPFSLPRTLVVKQLVDHTGEQAFLREAVSYQFANSLPTAARPGPELLAYDVPSQLLVMTDLGHASQLAEIIGGTDEDAATRALMAWAQALGRLHAATAGREEDFNALWRHAQPKARTLAPSAALQPSSGITPEGLCSRASGVLIEALGLGIPDEIGQLVTAAENHTGDLRAFSPADVSPDNILMTSDGVRFLDYEWGGFRDVIVDLAHALTIYPEWLRNNDFMASKGHDTDRDARMIDAWRSEIAGFDSVLPADEVLREDILATRTLLVWLSTYWYFEGGSGDSEHAHLGVVPSPQALRSRWRGLAAAARHCGHDALIAHTSTVLDRLPRL